MASNTYTRHTVTGSTQHSRKGTQGRKPIAEELRRSATIVLHVTESEKERFLEAQKKSGFSQSFFGSIFLDAGIRQLVDSINCSTQ